MKAIITFKIPKEVQNNYKEAYKEGIIKTKNIKKALAEEMLDIEILDNILSNMEYDYKVKVE